MKAWDQTRLWETGLAALPKTGRGSQDQTHLEEFMGGPKRNQGKILGEIGFQPLFTEQPILPKRAKAWPSHLGV